MADAGLYGFGWEGEEPEFVAYRIDRITKRGGYTSSQWGIKSEAEESFGCSKCNYTTRTVWLYGVTIDGTSHELDRWPEEVTDEG